jgi:hydroxyacylglutathione hydrolase
MLFRQVFDPVLAQYAYLIGCQRTGEALLIDPERDVDRYLRIAADEGLRITAVAETHIHADFLSGARELALRHGVRVYLSDEGGEGWRYSWPRPEAHDVVLLHDGDVFKVGNTRIEALHTPGHTPEHMVFRITDEGGGADSPLGLAAGDFVFVGSVGRPDLLETAAGVVGAREPSARALYRSVLGFLEMDDHLLVWPGHGAGSACGKALGSVPESTVGYERRFNPALADARKGEEAFVRGILEDQPEPPLYFARMKRLNRDGPPLLPGPGEDGLPRPERLEIPEVLGRAAGGAVVVDTRSDPEAFLSGHLPGSLHAPLGRDLAEVTASYVSAETPVLLIVESGGLEAAVRALVKVGIDGIVGWVAPSALGEARTELASIEAATVDEMVQAAARGEAEVLDVRGPDEYRAAHIPGARLAPHVRLPERAAGLPAGRRLYVHCQTGARSVIAASYLASLGRGVVAVGGDFGEWAAAHPDQVERGAPPGAAEAGHGGTSVTAAAPAP